LYLYDLFHTLLLPLQTYGSMYVCMYVFSPIPIIKHKLSSKQKWEQGNSFVALKVLIHC